MKTSVQKKHNDKKFTGKSGMLYFTLLLSLTLTAFHTAFAQTKPARPVQKPIPLKVYDNVKLGWGKGRANSPGYISLKNGILTTYNKVRPADRETQELIDVVFPGDWGSSGGGITIASPSSTGSGAANYEYCTNWQRKRGTQFAEIKHFDIAAFEKMKTVQQLQSYIKSKAPYYTDWIGMPDEGTAFLIKTEDGDTAIAFIHSINGTYGAEGANAIISFKTIEN